MIQFSDRIGNPFTARTMTALFYPLALFLIPILSLFLGRIIYSRFGLTVYGLVPISALDVTVDSIGLFWFRDNTHAINLGEITPLISSEIEIIIIGTGCHEVAKVEDAVRSLRL